TVRQVVAWARAYRLRTGRWPAQRSGHIPEAPGETWQGIGAALRYSRRGLPGGEGPGLVLHRRFGTRTPVSRPQLTIEQILGWADRHHKRTGRWPTVDDGKVTGGGGETWRGVRALRNEAAVLDRVMRQGRLEGIVPLLHTYLGAQVPCLEYEYVEGGDLAGLI